MRLKTLSTGLIATTALLVAGLAQARNDVQWSVTISGPALPVLVQPAPVYVQPAPVYAPPAPVYAPRVVVVQPPPDYRQPVPVVVAPAWVPDGYADRGRRHHHDGYRDGDRYGGPYAVRWGHDRDGDGWANRVDRHRDNPWRH